VARDETTSKDVPRATRIGNRSLELAENVVYIGIAALLVVTAVALLVVAAGQVLALVTGGGAPAAVEVLDLLLLVFIVVELLYAVRMTVAKRQLVAEPFLLVGIIASIKEIVVLSVKAADDIGKGRVFSDGLWEIGVLGVLVVLLGGTAWLLRVKEREPDEGDEAAGEQAEKRGPRLDGAAVRTRTR
jgi:uncharacterized membrane protein (DUF373 family)